MQSEGRDQQCLELSTGQPCLDSDSSPGSTAEVALCEGRGKGEGFYAVGARQHLMYFLINFWRWR